MSVVQRSRQIAESATAPTTKLQVDYVRVDRLRPSPKNARLHSRKKVRQLAQSIAALKVISPIIVDENFEILAGHARLEAAKLLGLSEVPVIQVKHLSEAEKRAYRLADNRFSEKATWDSELLSIEVRELVDLEFDIELTGFDTADVDIILSREDIGTDDDLDIPAVSSGPPVTQVGDLFQLGDHRLICGDARSPSVYKELMAGEKARLVVADAPYNVKIEGHVRGLGKTHHPDFAMGSGEFTFEQFVLFLRTVFILLVSNSADGAIHFIFMDWRHMREILEAGDGVFSELKNLVVWAKANGGMGSFYRSRHELIFVYKSGRKPHINNFELGQHGRSRTNVWEYPGVNSFRKGRMEELAMHPTCKPVELVADAIKDCSHRSGVVLDPFGGSGTTLISAERSCRRARLIELDPAYCDVIIKRWLALGGTTAIHVASGLSYTELALSRQPSASGDLHDHPQKRRRRR
jgi:DNA modification methylase